MKLNSPTPRRCELTLRKPWLGWFPKPTVVLNGTAQPAQWGTRAWKVPGDGAVTVNIYLFNRMWKFGEATLVVPSDESGPLTYRAPWLPFLPGKISTGS